MCKAFYRPAITYCGVKNGIWISSIHKRNSATYKIFFVEFKCT